MVNTDYLIGIGVGASCAIIGMLTAGDNKKKKWLGVLGGMVLAGGVSLLFISCVGVS